MKIKSEQQTYIDKLCKSTMFHMSLGSKELFHSNFLHWISIVKWEAFIQIMHGLAGVEKFWWEDERTPENGKVKVRREFHNFDLSIYILDSPVNNNEIGESEDENTESIRDAEGNEVIQKWIPVLILENKMKSLPYKEQLKKYTDKAFAEWCKGETIKMEIEKATNKKEILITERDFGITFILLSLMDANLSPYCFDNQKVSKRPKYNLHLQSKWTHKNYKDLFDLIKPSMFEDGLEKQIIEDYRDFIKALNGLASSCWIVSPEKEYRSQIFPWNKDKKICVKSKIQEIEDYKKLRIQDVHEKLLYDQLLSLLEKGLKEQDLPFCRFSKEIVQEQRQKEKTQRIRVFTNSGFAHGVGIFEAQYILSEDFILNGKKELLKLIIQVQGDRYCHMLIYDNIVKEDDKTVNVDVLKQVWKHDAILKSIPLEDELGRYISINGSSPVFKWKNGFDNKFKKYGNNLIYQSVEIPQTAKICDVIEAVLDDVKRIDCWYRKKHIQN